MKTFGLIFLIFYLLTMESKAHLPTYRMVEWATANDMS